MQGFPLKADAEYLCQAIAILLQQIRSPKSAFPYGNTDSWPDLFGITINQEFCTGFLALVPGYDLITVYHVKSEISEC